MFYKYRGDHDPSGLDMVRDIRTRLNELLENGSKAFSSENVEVIHVALTPEQVQTYKLPPNYAKVTDPRGSGYIDKFGTTSWEVDALPPEVLSPLVEQIILRFLDVEKYNAVISQEQTEIQKLQAMIKKGSDGLAD